MCSIQPDNNLSPREEIMLVLGKQRYGARLSGQNILILALCSTNQNDLPEHNQAQDAGVEMKSDQKPPSSRHGCIKRCKTTLWASFSFVEIHASFKQGGKP